jgi:sec-independent protein translocase protein TatC
MLFLERVGIFSMRAYAAQWRIAVLAIFVVAAILTPPDPTSMLLLAGSLTLLYFGGIVLCKLMPRKPGPFEVGRPK